MADVTGNFLSIAGAPLPPGVEPTLTVRLDQPAASLDGFLSGRPEPVTVAADGSWVAPLTPTERILSVGRHYIFEGGYLDPNAYGPGAGRKRHDLFEVRIVVPVEGGDIADLVLIDTSLGLAAQGPTPPATSMLWLYTEPTYDPDSGLPLPVYTAPDGTTVSHGELVEWSA